MDLRLRAIRSEDLATILQWRTSPAVADYMYTDFDADMEQQAAWFERIRGDASRMDWIVQVDALDVGLLSIVEIDPVHQRAEWAYYLGSDAVRGKGIGRAIELNVLRYVFEELCLNKLCCEVMASNTRVVQLHERFGSKVEGQRRSHIRKRGAFIDIIEMAILRSDWERHVRDAHVYERAIFEPLARR
jgi:UDP-4-amino-4,6-dideoxy-N-acetyl-beta-L-altrosamine N-acetyltransferase